MLRRNFVEERRTRLLYVYRECTLDKSMPSASHSHSHSQLPSEAKALLLGDRIYSYSCNRSTRILILSPLSPSRLEQFASCIIIVIFFLSFYSFKNNYSLSVAGWIITNLIFVKDNNLTTLQQYFRPISFPNETVGVLYFIYTIGLKFDATICVFL